MIDLGPMIDKDEVYRPQVVLNRMWATSWVIDRLVYTHLRDYGSVPAPWWCVLIGAQQTAIRRHVMVLSRRARMQMEEIKHRKALIAKYPNMFQLKGI